ncbi:MAG TPA: ATP-binding cassette domain-containing protein, partial [Devosia sp.]|nr:ATP-binding cassette domain-containing protein [Devosia sp.]
EDITGGELHIGGKLVNHVEPRDRSIAMVFQSYALYPHMTVYDNVGFGLKLAKTPKDVRDQKIREAARILKMEHLLDRKPGQLSGGQRQRVAIGRAIVRQPEVFLFDEPLSNLDAALRVDTRMEIAKLHADLGATMIYVTHDQVEAMTLADKIVVLDAGVVQQVGSPIELYQRPTNLFVAGFIGSPKMNFVEVTVEAVEPGFITVTSKDVASMRIPAASGTVDVNSLLTLGIRPHDLLPANNGAIVGRVSLVERLGNETIVNLELASGAAWLAVLEGDRPLRVGESLALAAEPEKAILFDKDGKALLA